jgi:hypothetical protein
MYVTSLRDKTTTIKWILFLAFISVISVHQREMTEDVITNVVNRIRFRQGKDLLMFYCHYQYLLQRVDEMIHSPPDPPNTVYIVN